MEEITEALTSRYVTAGGLRIHYNEAGSGHPLICIHGAGPGASAWSNFKQNIGELARHYRVILFDMPQYGKSEKPIYNEGRCTYVARVLADFMDQLGIQKAHFIGNSMGGATAVKLAIDYPEKVDKLILVGSVPTMTSLFAPMPTEGVRQMRAYYMDKEGPTPEKMRRLIQTFVHDSSFLTDELVQERYQATLDPEAIKIFSSHETHPKNEDMLADLHKVKAKTLIFWGLEDRFAYIDVGLLMMKKFADAQMHVFNKCGHWAQVEHAEEFNKQTLLFLAS